MILLAALAGFLSSRFTFLSGFLAAQAETHSDYTEEHSGLSVCESPVDFPLSRVSQVQVLDDKELEEQVNTGLGWRDVT